MSLGQRVRRRRGGEPGRSLGERRRPRLSGDLEWVKGGERVEEERTMECKVREGAEGEGEDAVGGLLSEDQDNQDREEAVVF